MKNVKWSIHKILLCISLVLCLIGGFGAKMVVSDGGKVTVTDVNIKTDMGTISGTLLVPNTASSKNKAPGIVVSHGASSNSESVDSWYVELARRGYVVLAPNLYAHGDSTIADAAYADTPEYAARGLIDDVEYLYSLPYVDTDKIAVMGHSLGGCCAMKTAEYYSNLEREALANGASAEEAHALNKVSACVTVGYPLEVKIDGMPSASSPDFNGYLCDLGVILGKCDDFQSWMNKDFLTNEFGPRWLKAQTGLEVTAVEEGVFYQNPENGYEFAAWNPNEIHNANMISGKTTGYIVDFFEHTYGAPNAIASANQTWGWKMFFNVVGMIGLFLFIIPCLYYVLKMPVFQSLARENTFVLPPLLGKARTKYLRSIIIGVLINTITFLPVVLIGSSAITGTVFPQGSTNGFVCWGLACGISTLIAVRKGTGLKYKGNAEYYGFQTDRKEFVRTLGLAVTVVGLTYLLVYGAKFLFNSQFQFWTYIIRPITANKLTVVLRYLPLFFVQQFANGIAIRRNNFDNWSDEKRIAFSTTMSLAPS